jgi:hypothetical protein
MIEEVIGEMETMGEWALFTSFETTSAGRVFFGPGARRRIKIDQEDIPSPNRAHR